MPLQNELDQPERLRRWKKLAQKRAELLRDAEADNARLRAAALKFSAVSVFLIRSTVWQNEQLEQFESACAELSAALGEDAK